MRMRYHSRDYGTGDTLKMNAARSEAQRRMSTADGFAATARVHDAENLQ